MERLKKYLLLTFAVSWVSWWTLALLTGTGVVTFSSAPGLILFVVGGFGPTISAIALLEGGRSLKNAVNYVFAHRRGTLGWLLLFCALNAAVFGLASREVYPEIPVFVIPFIFLMCVFLGGGNEELGWRGLMQPAMERRLPFPAATLVTGAVWAVWHLPLWFVEGSSQSGMPFPLFAAYAVILSFWLACVYKRTGCVFACSVLHGLSNTVVSVFVLKVNWILIAGLIVTTAAAILLWYDPWGKTQESYIEPEENRA